MGNLKQSNNTVGSVQVRHETHFSGPLPRPEDLEEYDNIVPGAAERILQMAEKEMQHRHEEDSKLSKNVITTTYLSILVAFLCVIIISFLSFYAMYVGSPAVGGTIAVGAIATVAGVFLAKKKKSKEE